MCKFLTGKARIQQVERKGYWRLLDNEVYKDDNGDIHLTPRNMLTDNYTIPLWIDLFVGSPVDFDTRCSHAHDLQCYSHEALLVNLTEEELKEKGYLRYSEKNKMWICEDVPPEFLSTRKISKLGANNMLFRSMRAAGIPLWDRIKVRIGVSFNLNWFIYKWLGKTFDLDLEKIYTEAFWEEHVRNWG